MSRKYFFRAVIALIFLQIVCFSSGQSVLYAADGADRQKYDSYAIGSIPSSRIFEMRDHTDSLFNWMSLYVDGLIPAGVTLIHIDAHADDVCACMRNPLEAMAVLDSFRKVTPIKRKEFLSSMCKKTYPGRAVDIETFIIPAMQMGIVKEFIWLKPNFHYFDQQGPWRKQPFFTYFLTREKLLSVTYCSQGGPFPSDDDCSVFEFETDMFPRIAGPVLLDVDMDTFGDRNTMRMCSLYFTPEQVTVMINELTSFLAGSVPSVYAVTIADSPVRYTTNAALQKKTYLKSRLTGK